MKDDWPRVICVCHAHTWNTSGEHVKATQYSTQSIITVHACMRTHVLAETEKDRESQVTTENIVSLCYVHILGFVSQTSSDNNRSNATKTIIISIYHDLYFTLVAHLSKCFTWGIIKV